MTERIKRNPMLRILSLIFWFFAIYLLLAFLVGIGCTIFYEITNTGVTDMKNFKEIGNVIIVIAFSAIVILHKKNKLKGTSRYI